jgi:hypothetical protein
LACGPIHVLGKDTVRTRGVPPSDTATTWGHVPSAFIPKKPSLRNGSLSCTRRALLAFDTLKSDMSGEGRVHFQDQFVQDAHKSVLHRAIRMGRGHVQGHAPQLITREMYAQAQTVLHDSTNRSIGSPNSRSGGFSRVHMPSGGGVVSCRGSAKKRFWRH